MWESRIAEYIDRQRPGHTIESSTPLDGGWASTLHTVTVRLPDGSSTTWVVKRFEPSRRGVAMLQREWLALNRLREVHYPVPQPLLAEPDGGVIGRPFLLMEFIDGVSLGQRLQSRAPEPASYLIEAFVRQLRSLHRLEPALFDSQPADPLRIELKQLGIDAEASQQVGLVPVVDWLSGHRPDRAQGPVILHRDYHPWNVIVDGAGRLWVLDWDWGVGDPRFDLAWTITLLARSGAEELSRAVVLEYACQSEQSVVELPYFEVLTTLRWLLNVLPALGPRSSLDEARRNAFREFLSEPLQRAEELVLDRTGLRIPTLED